MINCRGGPLWPPDRAGTGTCPYKKRGQARKTQYLLDIDLSILGAEHERYREYENGIREEYAWVSEDVFREKRAEILQAFLDREQIYYTELFRNKYESRARANLANALSGLRKKTG